MLPEAKTVFSANVRDLLNLPTDIYSFFTTLSLHSMKASAFE